MWNFITNNKFSFALLLVLLIGVFGFLPGTPDQLRNSRITLAEWAIVSFVALFLINNIWIVLFILWSTFSLIWTGFKVGNFTLDSYSSWYNIFLYSVFYYTIYKNINNQRARVIINGLCCIVLVQTLFMYFDMFHFRPLTYNINPLKNPITGLLDNSNFSGAFLAFTIPLFFLFFKKYGAFFLIPISFALFMTKSLSAITASLISLTIFVWVMYPKFKKYVLMASVLAVVLYGYKFENISQFTSKSQRMRTWTICSRQIIGYTPLTGIGIGNYPTYRRALLRRGLEFNLEKPLHNDPLQMTLEMGLPAALIIFGFIYSFILRIKKHRDKTSIVLLCSIIAIAVTSLGSFPFRMSLAIIPIIIFSMFDKLTKDEGGIA